MSLNRSIAFALAGLLCGASGAQAQTLGHCRFQVSQSAFAGDPATQAACLLRTVRPLGRVDAAPVGLPPRLSGLIGRALPFDRARLAALLDRRRLDQAALGGDLARPLSRGGNNAAAGPFARYFVIHDTSTPNFGQAPFPADIDDGDRVNGLARYRGLDAVAHLFVNRRGQTLVGHDFGTPWRATKIERQIGVPSKGLFLHVELVQPRRAHPHQADGTAPVPGFTSAQYDKLALLYLTASTRAGKGLIPAFHAALDEGLSDGHDDPQNFDLAQFDAALGRLLGELR